MVTIALYGSWVSPISVDTLVERVVGLADPCAWGAERYWVEARPNEGGRQVIVRRDGSGRVADLLPEERMGSGLGFYQGLAGGAALLAGVWAGLAWGSSGRLPLLVSGVVVAVLAGVLLLAGARLERGGVRSRVPA